MMPSTPGRRHLDQAELGIIGLVAQEFGVQRQIGRRRQLGDKGRQRLIGFHNPHRAVIADSAPDCVAFIAAVRPTVLPANPAASK